MSEITESVKSIESDGSSKQDRKRWQNQNEKLRRWFLNGNSLTDIEARDMGILSLGARIYELRKSGFPIAVTREANADRSYSSRYFYSPTGIVITSRRTNKIHAVKNWLLDGHDINRNEAFEMFGVIDLPSMIANLKQRGMRIKRVWEKLGRTRIARYSLIRD